jgi:hypothetical protein
MANEAQLSILKQGVEVWNKWRTRNRRVSIYLHKETLTCTPRHGQRPRPGQVCARRFATLAHALSRTAASAGEQIECLSVQSDKKRSSQ